MSSPLSITKLTKKYKGNNTPILDNISIDFNTYGIVGLLGKNGAGKTTFIKSCVNLLSYEGNISYFGKDLKQIQNEQKQTEYFSALFEGNRNIYWKLTPIENVKYFSALRGIKYSKIEKTVKQLIECLELKDKQNHLVESLSRGMQQKVALIVTLSLDNSVVFLDEPTLGLDLETKNNLIDFFLDSIWSENKLIIVSSHDFGFINSICKEIYLLKGARLHKKEKQENICNIFRFQMQNKLDQNELWNDLFQDETKLGNYYYYNVCGEDDIAKAIYNLKNESKIDNVISINNLAHDLETFYL